MKFTVKTGDAIFEADLEWDKIVNIKEHLKALGYTWDPTTKAWIRKTPPLFNAHVDALLAMGVKIPAAPYRIHRSYAYVSPKFINKEKFEYKVKHWRKATCEEYCNLKYPEWEECIDECEEEDWRRVIEVEDVVQLWKLMDDGSYRVPRGLLHLINANIEAPPYVQFKDIEDAAAGGLRKYQVEVASSALKSMEKYGGAIMQIATGGGKSYMAGWVARQLIRNGYNIVFTSLSIDLTRQLMDFAVKWGVLDLAKNYNVAVKAATIQTLYRRILHGKPINNSEAIDEEDAEVQQYMDEEDLSKEQEEDLSKVYYSRNTALILDEVHHVPARTVREVALNIGDGWGLRLGMSATPWRNDGRDLEVEAWIGPIVEPKINSSYLIQHGYAVPVEINIIKAGNWGCYSSEDKDAKAYSMVRKCLAESKERNEFIKRITAEAPKPVLILTTLIKHAKLLGDALQELGSIAVVTGVVKGEERAKVFNMVRENRLNILVATTLADEGLDLPPLRSLILTMGGKSKTRTLQRVGRLVRPWEGKSKAIVFDIVDSVWPFKDQAVERIKLYRSEPYWRINELLAPA